MEDHEKDLMEMVLEEMIDDNPDNIEKSSSEEIAEEGSNAQPEASSNEKSIAKPEKYSKKKITVTIVCIVLAVILAMVLGVLLVIDSYLDKIKKVEGPEPTISQEEIDIILRETDPPEETLESADIYSEDVTMPTAPAEQIETEDYVYNILLIGQDRRPGQGRCRSDSMILCTINTEKKTLVMTSFLRDTYVRFPEYNGKTYSDNRLNVPYVIGGMEMLDDCLELNFGVKVDHNVEVDFSGFEKIIDIMGGVGLELTEAEARHVPGAQAGWNHMDGEQALAYARIRKIDNDFGRTNRQRKVLIALLAQVKNTDIETLTDIADSIFPLITTDMTNVDIIGYLAKFVPILKDLEITTQHIPGSDSYRSAMIRGMSVIVPDLEECCQQLKDTIG